MKALACAESGFWFKGVRWTGEAFSCELKRVLALHRAMSNYRIAFHFGVTEKAVRKLRIRSQTADSVILCLIAEAKRSTDKPVRYRERNWCNNYPEDRETRKILIAAEAERERQRELRRSHRRRRAATGGVSHAEKAKAQRRVDVLQCKQSGLTQVLTAESLACSVRTVRRYW